MVLIADCCHLQQRLTVMPLLLSVYSQICACYSCNNIAMSFHHVVVYVDVLVDLLIAVVLTIKSIMPLCHQCVRACGKFNIDKKL